MVMVRERRDGVVPDQVTVPVESLDDAADSTSDELAGLVDSGAKQISIVHEVGHHTRTPFSFPLVDEPSAFVNQVGAF